MVARLSVLVITASGKFRWGPDEWDARKIPQAITFTTSMPGGFKTATITLPRPINRDYPDLNLLDTIQILGRGNKVLWEGRVQQLPRSGQDAPSITVGAVGWSAHLLDDSSFSEIYVGRDLSEWQGMSSARKQFLLNLHWTIGDGTVEPDPSSGLPALRLSIHDTWPVTFGVESMYDAGPGCTVAAIFWERASKSNYGGGGEPNSTFTFDVGVADDDIWTNFSISADSHTASEDGDGPSTYEPATPRRWAGMQWVFAAAGGVAGNVFDSFVRRIAVWGAHGLPKRGEDPFKGVYASDVIADVVARAAPLLKFSTGPSGSIQPSGFPIPHLVFKDPVTAQEVIKRANGYHLWDWAVWRNKEFFFQPPDPERRTWQARLSSGTRLDLDGTQVDDVYNGVFVTYTDPAGTPHTVGPPGSGADVTSSALVDTSLTNPVNAHGIPKKWAQLNISQTTTAEAAIQIGSIYLGEKGLPQRRGTLTVTGSLQHPTAGAKEACEMWAGDWVDIADFPSEGPRKIIETSYDTRTQANTCTLDNSTQKVDAILERLGVSLVGVA
jgi:hypothetical protein